MNGDLDPFNFTAVGRLDRKGKLFEIYSGTLFRKFVAYFQNKAAQRLALPANKLEYGGVYAHYLTEVVQGGLAFENIVLLVYLLVVNSFFVELVVDIANDLFDDV